jgi:indole-3-glycerol phosphate synthase
MFLEKIIELKKKEIAEYKKTDNLSFFKKNINIKPSGSLFSRAISKKDKLCLIAEIKKASPSAGIIRKEFEPLKIARIYEKSGASAISVLTEHEFFKGHIGYLQNLKKEISLPLLRKDFIIDEYQIYESKYYGADALLLIAAILKKGQLEKLLSLTHKLDMEAIIEIHDEDDLEKVPMEKAEIIGINNRNLKTFKVEIETTKKLYPLLPKDKTVVAESGIKEPAHIKMLKNLGINAALIGEHFMRAENIEEAVRDIMVNGE